MLPGCRDVQIPGIHRSSAAGMDTSGCVLGRTDCRVGSIHLATTVSAKAGSTLASGLDGSAFDIQSSGSRQNRSILTIERGIIGRRGISGFGDGRIDDSTGNGSRLAENGTLIATRRRIGLVRFGRSR